LLNLVRFTSGLDVSESCCPTRLRAFPKLMWFQVGFAGKGIAQGTLVGRNIPRRHRPRYPICRAVLALHFALRTPSGPAVAGSEGQLVVVALI